MVDKFAIASIVTVIISQLILILLKAVSIVNWSWFWIFTPLWSIYTIFLVIISYFIFSMVMFNIRERIRKR